MEGMSFNLALWLVRTTCHLIGSSWNSPLFWLADTISWLKKKVQRYTVRLVALTLWVTIVPICPKYHKFDAIKWMSVWGASSVFLPLITQLNLGPIPQTYKVESALCWLSFKCEPWEWQQWNHKEYLLLSSLTPVQSFCPWLHHVQHIFCEKFMYICDEVNHCKNDRIVDLKKSGKPKLFSFDNRAKILLSELKYSVECNGEMA